jgi:hypothetical protein
MTMNASPPARIADDLLDSVEAIAAYVHRTPRWVYSTREQNWGFPTHKRPGFGIYAFKSEIDAWLREDDTLTKEQPETRQ